MKLEGTWKVEMLGPYGWENIAIAFMQDGRFLAGNTEHYSIGSYDEMDGMLNARLHVTQLGESRTIFGEAKKEMDLKMAGEVENDNVITGKIFPSDNEGLDVKFRLFRLGDIA